MKKMILLLAVLAEISAAQQKVKEHSPDSLDSQIVVPIEIKDTNKRNSYYHQIPKLKHAKQSDQKIGQVLKINVPKLKNRVSEIERKRVEGKLAKKTNINAKVDKDSILSLPLFQGQLAHFVIDTVFTSEHGFLKMWGHLPGRRLDEGFISVKDGIVTGYFVGFNNKKLIIKAVDTNTVIAVETPYQDLAPGQTLDY